MAIDNFDQRAGSSGTNESRGASFDYGFGKNATQESKKIDTSLKQLAEVAQLVEYIYQPSTMRDACLIGATWFFCNFAITCFTCTMSQDGAGGTGVVRQEKARSRRDGDIEEVETDTAVRCVGLGSRGDDNDW